MKFAAIFTSNLDEFFMVRVAGLHDQVDAGIDAAGSDGRTPTQTIDEIRAIAPPQMERQARLVDDVLFPALAEHGIRIVRLERGRREDRAPRSTSASGARSSRS